MVVYDNPANAADPIITRLELFGPPQDTRYLPYVLRIIRIFYDILADSLDEPPYVQGIMSVDNTANSLV